MLARLLATYLAPHRWNIALVLVLQLVQVVASLLLPSLNAQIIDRGIARGDTGLIVDTGLVMLGIALVQVTAAIGAAILGARLALVVGRELRAAVFARVSSLSEREIASFGAASLLTRTTNDVQQLQFLVQMGAGVLVAAPLLCIGGVVLALGADLFLMLIMLITVPALVIPLGIVLRQLTPLFTRLQELTDRVNKTLREQLAGIRVIRAFARERQELDRFWITNNEIRANGRLNAKLDRRIGPVINVTWNVASAVVILVGAIRIEQGITQIGALIAVLGYLGQVLGGVLMASFFSLMVPRSLVSGRRVAEVLNTESTIVAPADPKTAPIRGGVEFRGVGFSYPRAESSVLVDVDFMARPGKTTAIVGGTGAGKTTIVNLLMRSFDVTSGAVLIDGVDVRDLDPDDLRRRIAVIPQRAQLFAGTVASNLRYGDPDATDADLWDALRIAQADDFVTAMPDGLESVVDQGGANLSGGQRQRLAIARAIVKRAPIYLFDDALSALDTATDARLRAALNSELRGATVIVVALRLSSIMDADEIVVIDHGRIVGRGRHAELLARCPEYAEIAVSQLAIEDAA